MKPIDFEERNMTLVHPEHQGEDRDEHALPVYYDEQQYVSCWKLTFAERIKALLFGRVWMIVAGVSHPPVSVLCDRTAFVKKEDAK